MIPIYVLTNDKHLWALKPFSYLFNMFWDEAQPVTVMGFNAPDRQLPNNFDFVSIDDHNYPANRWTNALLVMLDWIKEDHFVLLLEDYWLKQSVDIRTVELMLSYAQQMGDSLLRIDLTADRVSVKHTKFDFYRGVDIIRTPHNSPYQMSFQAAVWHRQNLMDVLVPGETPWQAEVHGTRRLFDRQDLLVLGTTKYPVHYVPAVRSHKHGLQHMERFPPDLRRTIVGMVPGRVR